MIVKFVDLKVGDIFKMNDREFTRIADERINCCTVMNAQAKDNNEKIQVIPITEVEKIA